MFDSYVTGTSPVYSESRFQDLLGFPDQLSIGGYTAQVAGSSPKLTVEIEQSFDKERWQPRSTPPEINLVNLSAPSETPIQGHDGDPSLPVFARLAFVRLKVTLSGTRAPRKPYRRAHRASGQSQGSRLAARGGVTRPPSRPGVAY